MVTGPRVDRRLGILRWTLLTAFFGLVAALLFIRQLPPERVLLPIDALFSYAPYRQDAARLGVNYPENPLVADTILQNYGWKQFAAEQWRKGQPPLWNPHILSGQPFLAAGQNGSLYPFGALFALLPLADAYEAFAILHFTLAGVFAAMFARTLGTGWLGSTISGLTFALSGFLVVSVVWPMMVSTAIWLPLILGCIHRALSSSYDWQSRGRWLALGATVIALQFLAGHLEISFYILATSAAYAGLRLAPALVARPGSTLGIGAGLLGMVAAGALLAAVQIVPFIEAIGQNVRVGQVTFDEVQGYAFDRGQWWSFVLPDFFGNPTHRTYLDTADGSLRTAEHLRERSGGQELRRDTEWGKRNYVEGASYLGITALVLALIGALTRHRKGWPLTVIAIGSLCFAFGTPLYALVFYGLPGGNQVHTPFRWVYPWTLCLATLAGLGADTLLRGISTRGQQRWVSAIASMTCGLGLLSAVAAAGFWLLGRSEHGVHRELIKRWPEIRDGFSSGLAFTSYLAPQMLGLALLLLVSGVLVLAARRCPGPLPVALLGALLATDLWSSGMGFNPSGDRALLGYQPPALELLRAQPGQFRIAALGPEDVLPANLAMRSGLDDIRGYDTIISRDYVDYLTLIERPGALLYSKIEKLFDERSLSSPLFHALNVKFVLAERPITAPGYELISSDGVNVYQNTRALPRASVVYGVQFVHAREDALSALRRADPASTVIIEVEQAITSAPSVVPARASSPAEITNYEAQEVRLRARAEADGFLVIMDAYMPGWVAQVDGIETTVLRANRAFRAVQLPPGEHDIVLQYRPLSFRLGLILSGLGGLCLTAVVVATLWPVRQRTVAQASPLGVVLRNISAPFAANLVSRVLDLGLALVMFRFLGPSGVGAFTFAIVITGYLDILAGFGLSTLVTREAARHPERVGTYLGNSLLLRAGFWTLSAAVAWLIVGPYAGVFEVGTELALAIVLLALGLLPSSFSATISALFQARDRFDVPASVTLVSAVLKMVLGMGALLAGWGFVGLAAVSIATNLVTATVLAVAAAQIIGLPRPRIDRQLALTMLVAAYPLMVSQVLNALFFRMDALLLKPLAGEEALGWYSTAYRFIDAFQIIPSTVILALFPMLSRQADNREATIHSGTLTIRALLSLAFPIAVGTTVLAEPIILAFAGPDYVPQSVVALQILIWYLPLSFVNGLVQYVLIARGRQRVLTLAFGLGVIFNLAANLWLIPRYGYLAAAWITVASELVLLIPFWLALRREGVSPNLWRVAWRPLVSALVMSAAILAISPINPIIAGVVGSAIYAAALLLVRGVTVSELRALHRAV
ncbi:MAG: oligosaccharide flippase family protein [Chloroflexota bacterium]